MRRNAVVSIAMAALFAACSTAPQQHPSPDRLRIRERQEPRVSQPAAGSLLTAELKRPIASRNIPSAQPSMPISRTNAAGPTPSHRLPATDPHPAATASSRPVLRSLDARVLYIAGHTRNTENKGAFSATGVREHVYNDLLLEAIKRATEKSNALYLLSSLDLSLRRRPGLPMERGAQVYVELHHDTGFANDVARKAWDVLSGYSVFYSGNSLCASESALLARSIGRAMREYGLKPSLYYTKGAQAQHKVSIDRQNGVYASDFYVLENARVPAVLVECGNIANPHEEALLGTRRMMTAGAIREGVLAYLHR